MKHIRNQSASSFGKMQIEATSVGRVLNALAEKLPEYWTRNYNVGSLSGYLYNGEAELYLKGFEIPPQLLPYLEGYFTSVICMVIGNKRGARITSIDRSNRNETCYRIVLKWNN